MYVHQRINDRLVIFDKTMWTRRTKQTMALAATRITSSELGKVSRQSNRMEHVMQRGLPHTESGRSTQTSTTRQRTICISKRPQVPDVYTRRAHAGIHNISSGTRQTTLMGRVLVIAYFRHSTYITGKQSLLRSAFEKRMLHSSWHMGRRITKVSRSSTNSRTADTTDGNYQTWHVKPKGHTSSKIWIYMVQT